MRLLPLAGPWQTERQWAPTGVGKAEPRYANPDIFDALSLLMTWFHAPAGVNKTIAVWPEQGSGVVIALIRKGIGLSRSGSTDSWSGEWEAGFFEASQWVWLYVVKHSMAGLLNDLTLVPMDAIEKETSDAEDH